VAFFVGPYEQSGSNNLFFDISTQRLGIGTTSPQRQLEVAGEGLIGGVILGSEDIGIASKTDLINLLSSGVTINGSLTSNRSNQCSIIHKYNKWNSHIKWQHNIRIMAWISN